MSWSFHGFNTYLRGICIDGRKLLILDLITNYLTKRPRAIQEIAGKPLRGFPSPQRRADVAYNDGCLAKKSITVTRIRATSFPL